MLFCARTIAFLRRVRYTEKRKKKSDGNAMLQFAIPCLLGLESLVGDEVKKSSVLPTSAWKTGVCCAAARSATSRG